MLSALSPNVKRIITEIGVHNDSTSKKYLTSSKLINWQEVCGLLPEVNGDDDINTADYFEKCAHGLGFLFQECEQVIQNSEDLIELHKELISWTGQDYVLRECFKLVKSGSSSQNYVALLLLTSSLERALGDVYETKNKICPSLLKDLLASEFLKKIIGDTAIQVLRAVIGLPASLNLRNVVWHGFPSDQEISKRYTSFLLMVFPSLNQFIDFKVVHRPTVSFTCENLWFDLSDNLDLPVREVKSMLKLSDFIPMYQLGLWQHGMDLYVSGDHGMAVVLLLPLFEHALRCLFTKLNGCPERTITAEATTLYTILDEILGPYVSKDVENRLPGELGHPVMDLLLDLFCYPSGPRIRDKLSHGEANIFDMPRPLCTVVVGVIIHIAGKYEKSSLYEGKAWFQRINSWVDQYESVFHPVSLLKSKVKQVAMMASKFSKHIVLDYNRVERATWMTEEILNPHVKENDEVVKEISGLVNLVCEKWYDGFMETDIINRLFCPFSDGSSFINDMLSIKIKTLFWKQKETDQGSLHNEAINLLHKISCECEMILNQVYTTLDTRQEQFIKKQLRSRQRDNLGSLLDSCFLIQQTIHLTLFFVSVFLVTIETKTTNEKDIKFIKVMLQSTENIRTYSNEKNNKWQGCVELLFKFIEKSKLYLQCL